MACCDHTRSWRHILHNLIDYILNECRLAAWHDDDVHEARYSYYDELKGNGLQ
jgi:hypothetical protein